MSDAQSIIDALGGWGNIKDLDACITRIRLDVVDADVIDERALRDAGAFDVIIVGDAVQGVVGPDSEEIVDAMNALR